MTNNLIKSQVFILRQEASQSVSLSSGLAHTRVTPMNCHDLLFDDVFWVEQAKRDHADFVYE